MIKTAWYIWNHPLASRNRITAFGRYFRWQIGSRILGHPVLMPFISGTHLVVEPGMTGATGNIYCGLHEFADMAFMLHFLRPGNFLVDVGANVGTYSVLAAGVVGANVLALEPLPQTFSKLLRNIRENSLNDQVVAKCCAAGASKDRLLFTADLDTMNRLVTAEADYSGSTVTVSVVPLDDLLVDQHPVMWKIDVEGFEPAVLAGARCSLADEALLAVLLEGDQPEVVSTMIADGFIRAAYEPFSRTLRTAAQKDESSSNALWVRARHFETVRQRCATAPSIFALGQSI